MILLKETQLKELLIYLQFFIWIPNLIWLEACFICSISTNVFGVLLLNLDNFTAKCAENEAEFDSFSRKIGFDFFLLKPIYLTNKLKISFCR